MAFPQTRRSLIQQIAAANDEAAWRQFVDDYWGPLCRFALRRGRLRLDDAADVAADVFVAILNNRLLARWIDQPSARLRTLLCSVVRNLLANRARIEQGRAELRDENRQELEGRAWIQVGLEEPSAEQADTFYAAWVEELLQSAVESLVAEYHRKSLGDHFRVLYGRLCEGATSRQVAEALGLTLSQSENAYKHALRRLRERLQELVRGHTERYGEEENPEADFQAEWGRLIDHLEQHGGLERIVSQAYQGLDVLYQPENKLSSIHKAVQRIQSEIGRKLEDK